MFDDLNRHPQLAHVATDPAAPGGSQDHEALSVQAVEDSDGGEAGGED
jgi:hypothetical protein